MYIYFSVTYFKYNDDIPFSDKSVIASLISSMEYFVTVDTVLFSPFPNLFTANNLKM